MPYIRVDHPAHDGWVDRDTVALDEGAAVKPHRLDASGVGVGATFKESVGSIVNEFVAFFLC